MADNNSTFTNVYNVTYDSKGNKYTVHANETKPYTNATILDNGTSGSDDKTYELGEIESNKFTVGGTEFTYLGIVTELSGNVALDGAFLAVSGGKYYLFSDGAVNGSKTFTSVTATKTVICFLPGTQIATPEGEVSVETLQRGDLVQTMDGRVVPVRWIGRQTISTLFADPLRVLPICIKAGALAENVPSRDLYVSPDHAILIDDILVHASALVNGTSIVRAPAPAQTFTYYHVELADHSLLLADNVPAESFIDNVDRLAFDNWDEHEALGDEAAPLVEMSYPRAKAARQVPVAIRERLAARGQALFGTVTTKAA